MNTSAPILTEIHGSSMVVRFNRPETRNPLTIEVVTKLHAILDSLGNDNERLIFTGTEDVFASGADLREIAGVEPAKAREFALRGQALMKKIAGCGITTVAAVNGPCFGGALDLSLSCTKRIASPQAIFSHPGADLGIITGWGGTQRLPRLIGQARALEMLITAKRVGAEEALRIGLVDEISNDPLASALTAV